MEPWHSMAGRDIQSLKSPPVVVWHKVPIKHWALSDQVAAVLGLEGSNHAD